MTTDINTVVEINLRLPSMLHGKKGFDRIVYAFKNVLTTPVIWHFHDLGAEGLLQLILRFVAMLISKKPSHRILSIHTFRLRRPSRLRYLSLLRSDCPTSSLLPK